MSKAKSFTKDKRKARSRVSEYDDQLPGKMLGKLAKMRHGSGPSRLNRNDIYKAFDEADVSYQ